MEINEFNKIIQIIYYKLIDISKTHNSYKHHKLINMSDLKLSGFTYLNHYGIITLLHFNSYQLSQNFTLNVLNNINGINIHNIWKLININDIYDICPFIFLKINTRKLMSYNRNINVNKMISDLYDIKFDFELNENHNITVVKLKKDTMYYFIIFFDCNSHIFDKSSIIELTSSEFDY